MPRLLGHSAVQHGTRVAKPKVTPARHAAAAGVPSLPRSAGRPCANRDRARPLAQIVASRGADGVAVSSRFSTHIMAFCARSVRPASAHQIPDPVPRWGGSCGGSMRGLGDGRCLALRAVVSRQACRDGGRRRAAKIPHGKRPHRACASAIRVGPHRLGDQLLQTDRLALAISCSASQNSGARRMFVRPDRCRHSGLGGHSGLRGCFGPLSQAIGRRRPAARAQHLYHRAGRKSRCHRSLPTEVRAA